jgi:hypothetical protein
MMGHVRALSGLTCAAAALALAAAGSGAGAARPDACPAGPLSTVPPNAWSAARLRLVPRGAAAVRLCRYLGSSEAPPHGLAHSTLLAGRAAIARLEGALDALPAYPNAVFFCPLDDGSQVLALFAYAGGRHVTVAVQRTGCHRAGNGDLVRIASGWHDTPGAERLNTLLWRLTKPLGGNARVAGVARLCGGPAPGRCVTPHATVTVLDHIGDVVALAPDSRFAFALPAGRYTLLARTGDVEGRRTVTLIGGRTVHTTIVIAVP